MRFEQREGVGVTSLPDRQDGLSSRGTSRSPGPALLSGLAAGPLGFALGEITRFETRKLELALLMLCLLPTSVGAEAPQEGIRLDDQGRRFSLAASGAPFVPWGFNYDHDDEGPADRGLLGGRVAQGRGRLRPDEEAGGQRRPRPPAARQVHGRPGQAQREGAGPAGEAARPGRADRAVPRPDRPGLLPQEGRARLVRQALDEKERWDGAGPLLGGGRRPLRRTAPPSSATT